MVYPEAGAKQAVDRFEDRFHFADGFAPVVQTGANVGADWDRLFHREALSRAVATSSFAEDRQRSTAAGSCTSVNLLRSRAKWLRV
jgi:hypothetical protein